MEPNKTSYDINIKNDQLNSSPQNNLEDTPAVSESSKKRALSKKDKMNLHDLGGNMNLFYQFSHFVNYYRLNRHYPYRPFRKFQIISIIIGKIQSKPFGRRMAQTWKVLHPEIDWTKKKTERWTHRYFRYVNELFWEITFYFNREYPKDADYFYPVEGFKNIENAVKKNKGILVPTLHLGQMFHPGASLLHRYVNIDGKKWKLRLAGIASAENEFLFRDYLKSHPEAKIIITGKKRELEGEVIELLKHRYMVFIMQDFAHSKQLRVPFIYGNEKHDFLIPVPSLLSDLYQRMDLLILPILSIPGKDIRFSTVTALPEIDLKNMDPNDEPDPILREEIKKFQNGMLSRKESNGLIALYINKIINPYILKYPYLWEEALPFTKRARYRIHYNRIGSYRLFFEITIKELIKFLENSYEPGRPDEKIIPKLKELIKNLPETHSHVNLTQEEYKKKENVIIQNKKEEKLKNTIDKRNNINNKKEDMKIEKTNENNKEINKPSMRANVSDFFSDVSNQINRFWIDTKEYVIRVSNRLMRRFFIHKQYLDIGLKNSREVFSLIGRVLKLYFNKFKKQENCVDEREYIFSQRLKEYMEIVKY